MSFYDALELENLDKNPFCSHGPTVLFENVKEQRKYFACSAIRNHKKCNFYQDHREFNKEELENWFRLYKKSQKKLKRAKKLRLAIKSLNFKDRKYCKTCDRFVFGDGKCVNHDILKNIKKLALKKPSECILNPLIDDDSNAQFFFNERTIDYFMSIIEKFQYDSVLCVGTPSVFEAIQCSKKCESSFLLDIDDRFMQFYSNKIFLKHNMFNNHFFYNNKSYLNFLNNSKNLLIIIDPPYGGLVKLIANTIHKLVDDCKKINKQASIILIYPYFIEIWIQKWLPELKMVDFKVSYRNQTNFSEKKVKKGSPARLFTNIIDINKILIPKANELNDYYYCDLCEKYTYSQNKHCFKCMKCTSKDGGIYKHCDFCKKCVKNSYIHCKSCNVCHLKDCCFKNNFGLKCYKCQSSEHKSRDCDFK